jgi:UDP-N-acetylglucosamine acyltransferase
MIHPTAQIADGAQIAADVQIGAYCKVSKEVTLASAVILEAHVTVEGPVTIGEKSHLFPFSHIGNGTDHISIGRSCHIREFTHIATDESETGSVMIGDACYIMAYADIHTDVGIEEHCIITNNVILGRGSYCQSRVIIGAKATVAENCTIGAGTMIGGVSAVMHDIPPYCLVEGHPDATIRGLNLVGMRRGFQDRKSISSVKQVFMQLKKVGFDQESAAALLAKIEDTHAQTFVRFVAAHSISR